LALLEATEARASQEEQPSFPHDLLATNSMVFLIAAYPIYQCPYVWHISEQESQNLDHSPRPFAPLKLHSTGHWADDDIRLGFILSELVMLTARPNTPPDNPFEVDHDYFDHLPIEESILLSAAMIQFLQFACTRSIAFPFSKRVSEDLRKLQKRHFQELDELVMDVSLGVEETQ
jgi:hypothetical protein